MKKLLLFLPLAMLTACANRMTVAEMTVIGLSATPGNANTEMPQVTIAYKRAEIALIPTQAQCSSETNAANTTASDCFSAFSSLYFSSKFFGPTKISDVLSTGFASRDLVTNSNFSQGFGYAVTNTNTNSK